MNNFVDKIINIRKLTLINYKHLNILLCLIFNSVFLKVPEAYYSNNSRSFQYLAIPVASLIKSIFVYYEA